MRHNWFLFSEKLKIAYLPILRNGNLFYKTHFSNCGWKTRVLEGTVDYPSLKNTQTMKIEDIKECFCPVRHPKDKFITSLASILHSTYTGPKTYFMALDFKNKADIASGIFFLTSVHNDHLHPISFLYSELFDKIYPIPMDYKGKNCNQLIVAYLQRKGLDTNIPMKGKSHISPKPLNDIKTKIKLLLNTEKGNQFYTEYLEDWYKQDLELYNKAHELQNLSG